ncbi:MAG TPA: bifunctional rhamnulose-1-phosphate aldolase/short-chain dehydrogenase [Thermoanaerobaculia bacterium]|nr:bifunctional rhamnulose-1-phosphate aldolase/short-chain dehydrogenase [Thermoanaerobaculia bacterium]
MLNRWDPATTFDLPLDELVYQSRLVGAEEGLVLWGGGNNSLELTALDLVGAALEILHIKGSGSDMKSIVPRQFPAVRLDYVRPLIQRSEMSDEEMVDILARCLIDPSSPRPSIETLLHAFIPRRAVLHTHADAILAVTNSRGREATVQACFGDDLIVVPYRRPGFALSRLVGLAYEEQPGAVGLILMNHGLITWGDSPREAYDSHIELVSRAEEFIWRSRKVVAPSSSRIEVSENADQLGVKVLAPVLRGLLSQERPMVLEFDDSPETLAFIGRNDASSVTQIGPATPDHLLYTKRFPLLVGPLGNDPASSLSAALERYRGSYSGYFERNKGKEEMLDPLPRVILATGVGMWTAGRDARGARIVRDIYRHTMRIIGDAAELGGFATLTEREAYDAEYWPLELYKLTLLPRDKDLAGRIVLVTGAASGIGRVIARRFAAEGAHVMVCDIDEKGAEDVASSIVDAYGLRRATAVSMDVTIPASVEAAFLTTLRELGGLDVVVSNAGIASVGSIDTLPLKEWERSLAVNTTGHFLVAREAMRIFRAQRIGGNMVFMATKNVTAPGKDFGAYSVSKAAEAQLCRIVALEGGEIGVRANMVNPDAVLGGSGLWSDDVRKSRAAAYGFAVEELPAYYKERNLLKVEVTAEDVAEAALFLATSRSAKTTGAMIPVDGGLREAFPR